MDNDAAMKAAKEHLWRHRAGLRRAIATLERRTAATPRSVCGCGPRRGCEACRDGYATPNERFQKQRRLASRTAELARVEAQLTAKDYPVVYGGRRLVRARHHFEEAGLTVDEWRTAWAEKRSWFGCAGNVGKPGGNPCLTLNRGEGGRWYLTVSVPKPVAERFGVATRVALRHPVPLHHRSLELQQRLDERLAIRLDIAPATDKKRRVRTYLRASWVRPAPEPRPLEVARACGVVALFGCRKAFRHTIAGFPTTQFKDRVVAMARAQGLEVIAVDPRYTSRYGGAAWQRALTTPTVVATRHEGAAVAIGRRALGHGLTTRAGTPTGTPVAGRSRQRPVPHQRDGSTSHGQPTAAQERATADTTEATPRPGIHQPPVHERQPSRRPPRSTDVVTPEGLSEPVRAGHRFPGVPPGG